VEEAPDNAKRGRSDESNQLIIQVIKMHSCH
jgi:hypothetical protein